MTPEDIEDVVDRVIFQKTLHNEYSVFDTITHVVRDRALTLSEKRQVQDEYGNHMLCKTINPEKYQARKTTAEDKFTSVGRSAENPSRRDWP